MSTFQQDQARRQHDSISELHLQAHILESKLRNVLLVCNPCHHLSKSSRSAPPTRLKRCIVEYKALRKSLDAQKFFGLKKNSIPILCSLTLNA